MKLRINCIQVTVNTDLTVMYRLALPIKGNHKHVFPKEKVSSYIRKNSIRHQFVFESGDSIEVLKQLKSAQIEINVLKQEELKRRGNQLLEEITKL